MTMNDSEDFEAKYERYLASFHRIPESYDIGTYQLLMARFRDDHRKQQQMNKPDLQGLTTDNLPKGQFNQYCNIETLYALAECAARRELRKGLENHLLFYPLGKKEVLGLILAYTLLMIGVSIYLTVFVLSQMGKIS